MRQTPEEEDISEVDAEAMGLEEGEIQENPEADVELGETNLEDLKNDRLEAIDSEVAAAVAKPEIELEQAASSVGMSESELKEMENAQHAKQELDETNSEIKDLGQSFREKIGEVGTEKDESVNAEKVEVSAEKQEIIDKAGEQRAGIFKRSAYKILDFATDIAPFISGGKEIYKGIEGESDGKKLTTKERIVHGALGAAYIALDLVGVGEGREAAVAAGKGIVAVEKLAVYAAKKGKTKLASMFSKTAEFMARNPEITAKVEGQIDKHINKQIKKFRSLGDNYTSGEEVAA